MNTFVRQRLSTALGGALVAGALLAAPIVTAPTQATAAPLAAEDTPVMCVVTDGALTWGVKESFRAYISGSIANGAWEASDGASYETPDFTWTGGTGEFDPVTGAGSVSFQGTVHFTGHDGVLDLTLANPTVEFEDDGTAALLLDSRSTDASGELVVDAAQEWVGDITEHDPFSVVDGTIGFAEMVTVLTNSGAKAFAGFYEPGQELDPLTITLTAENCEGSVATPGGSTGDESQEPGATEPEPTGAEVPWMPIIIGGVAILVIGITAGVLFASRGKGKKPSEEPSSNITGE